jgi:epoxyqueuosine reductase
LRDAVYLSYTSGILTEIITTPLLVSLREQAANYGFSGVYPHPADAVEQEFRHFYQNDFLGRGRQADLGYLGRKERFDLTAIYPGVNTLLMFTYPYRFEKIEKQFRAAPYKVARYAWQRDYHLELRGKIATLLANLELAGRAVTDSAPLLERYWARRAGAGRIGQNGMLISRESGSYFLLAAALTAARLEPGLLTEIRRGNENAGIDRDLSEICGSCRLCIDACPTQALLGDGQMETAKCISYQTIESKSENLDLANTGKKHRWIFGCDICQQVCPHNKTAASYADDAFCTEHPVAAEIAAGRVPPIGSALRGSVFERRGGKKLLANQQSIDHWFSESRADKNGE